MQTARGLDPALDIEALAGAALAALAELEGGRAEITGAAFRFAGQAVDKARMAAVESRLRLAIPPAFEVGAITFETIAASPFRTVARRTGGKVLLTGHVPGDRERRQAATLVASRYPGETLIDRRVAADGAPAGFAEAQRAALDGLAEIAEGEATLRDVEMRLSGRVLYGQVAARLRELMPRSAPPGWSTEVALDPVTPEGALDAVACGDVLADVSRRDPVRFEPGKPEPATASRAALDSLAAVVRRCGAVRIAVTHRAQTQGDLALASARAETLVSAFRQRGATARLEAAGSITGPAAGSPAGPERTDYEVAP